MDPRFAQFMPMNGFQHNGRLKHKRHRRKRHDESSLLSRDESIHKVGRTHHHHHSTHGEDIVEHGQPFPGGQGQQGGYGNQGMDYQQSYGAPVYQHHRHHHRHSRRGEDSLVGQSAGGQGIGSTSKLGENRSISRSPLRDAQLGSSEQRTGDPVEARHHHHHRRHRHYEQSELSGRQHRQESYFSDVEMSGWRTTIKLNVPKIFE
ncbi:unnamed protein product [Didymodactylos carnosus]|uniref:Uncharacterized protein n=1 Tax=Didymodactylos carnosus TaxID=1234261 RepID=A0A814CDL1_9BILA|nr:unnamed protein product [Didymodactylos carnosus]CAF3715590.1 unnamed protein product [Didymodactylos carnosus]